MTLVTIRHEYLVNDEVRIEDEQDIIYRDVPSAMEQKSVKVSNDSPETSQSYDWSREIMPDSVLLFRYSAISLNSHRIHYDRDYAEQEGYPGLLVHGPLTATLLIDLFQRSNQDTVIREFAYTARRPIFVDETFTIMGRKEGDGRISLQAVSDDGNCSMFAELHTA
jgi:3-methylfumaryl-CoA hydratase